MSLGSVDRKMGLKSVFLNILRGQESRQYFLASNSSYLLVNQTLRGVVPLARLKSTYKKDNTVNLEHSLLLSALCAPGSEAFSIDELMIKGESTVEDTLKKKTIGSMSTLVINNVIDITYSSQGIYSYTLIKRFI